MNGTIYNLLTDLIIRVEDKNGTQEKLTLPSVLASLTRGDEIASFSALQPHQWPAWYAFLVQVAALSLLNFPDDWRKLEEADWRKLLRSLTPLYEKDEPWCLVVTDLSKPAFMQSPVPEGSLKNFKGPIESPDDDEIDVLVTAKNHDLKYGRQVHSELDAWIIALIMLQTQSGYSGKYNYGIIRMNGGYGSRPLVGLAQGRSWGIRFRRDLDILLRLHDTIATKHERPGNGSIKLLWLEPWDGETGLPLKECDPYVIEVARRIRLIKTPVGINAYRKETGGARLTPKSEVLKGNVGDPWIPIRTDGAGLTVGPGGLNYDLMRQLLLGDGYQWSICQYPQPDDHEILLFYAAALARGQGGTEGYHERWISIPKERRFMLFDKQKLDGLKKMAKERIERTGNVRKSALRPALLTLIEGAPEQLNFKIDLDRRWLDAFEAQIDKVFFPQLWEDAELEIVEQQCRWARTLRSEAEAVLKLAENEAPIADVRRERAIARAWMVLNSSLRKRIPEAYEYEQEVVDDETI